MRYGSWGSGLSYGKTGSSSLPRGTSRASGLLQTSRLWTNSRIQSADYASSASRAHRRRSAGRRSFGGISVAFRARRRPIVMHHHRLLSVLPAAGRLCCRLLAVSSVPSAVGTERRRQICPTTAADTSPAPGTFPPGHPAGPGHLCEKRRRTRGLGEESGENRATLFVKIRGQTCFRLHQTFVDPGKRFTDKRLSLTLFLRDGGILCPLVVFRCRF